MKRRDAANDKKARPALWRRLLRTAIILAASAWGFYVIAMNAFLSTSLFDKVVNQDPESIDIHYRRGWSFWPGHIHARDLSIRGKDSNVEWILRLDRVAFGISFWGLTKQHFDVSYAHGRGISFRLRQRLDAAPRSPEEVADLPPIPGFLSYSVRPPKVETPDVWHDEHYHLWQPHLEDVVAEDVREIWIDSHRFEGLSRITGRFHLIPVRSVDIGPVHVAVHEGKAMRGRTISILEGLDGSTATVRVARFDPRTASGDDVVHAIDTDVDAHGQCPDLSRLPLGSLDGVTLHGAGELNAFTLHVQRGIVKEGSRIDAHTQPAVVTKENHHFSGDLTLTGEVRDRLHVRIEAPRLDVTRGKHVSSRAKPGFAHAKKLVVTADSGELDLTHPLTDTHVVVVAPDIALPDVRALSAYLPEPSQFVIRGGRVQANVHAEGWLADTKAKWHAKVRTADIDLYAPNLRLRGSPVLTTDAGIERGVAHGSVELDAPRLAASYRDLEMNGRVHARVKVPAFSLGGRRLAKARAEVDVTGASVSQARLDDKAFHVRGNVAATADLSNWSFVQNTMTVDGVHAAVSDVEGGLRRNHSDFRANRVTVHARLANLDWNAPSLGAAETRLQVDGAEIPDLRTFNAVLPTGNMLAIESGRARLDADITMLPPATHAESRGAEGQIHVKLSRAGIRFHETRLTGDYDIVTQLQRYVPERLVDMTGTRIHMRNIEVTHATTETSHWSGDALFQEALVRLGPKPGFEGQFSLNARDASPLLAILLRDSLPKLFAGLTHMPHLQGSSQFSVTPDHLAFRNVDARGGDLAIHGFYVTREKERHGAFVVEKGVISAGVGLGNDGAYVHLFELDDWLQKERQSVIRLLEDAD
ncbi:hypothetical protein LVJ94_00425 [Pendulispora rubella]|uniref:DUF3971 domain-containing protein n=1 Tax=Pendulispora rubella TaxID=2741070 RepID=A0ABZ2L846_9BACT